MFKPIYKYRIVKLGGYDDCYRVDKRFMLFFWETILGGILTFSYSECEEYIAEQIERKKPKPADTVVKLFRG